MIENFVKKLTEKYFDGVPFKVGDTVEHPSGKKVRITSGQYWGTHGISNFWYWREVLSDGKLSEKEEHGYGWS